MMDSTMDIKSKIRTIPDFPKKGIMFKDITTLLQDEHAFRHAVREMIHHFDGRKIHKVASAESRGFIFGSILAYELHAGFVPLRKPGKLPSKSIKLEFTTEYSTDAFEIHADAIRPGENVLIVDDLLATGGTAKAAAVLVEKLGGRITGFCFLIELSFLRGRDKLKGYDIFSLIDYDKEE